MPQTYCATKEKSSGNYLPTLDGWRAIAISLVIFAHASDSIINATGATLSNYSNVFKSFGLIGVQLFFGLSGFLITSNLINEERRNGKISLQSFYIRRAFRILPASLFYLTVIGILGISGVLNITTDRWLSTLLFSANYYSANHSWYLGHFWSLAVEEHFYFLWPAVFLFLKTTKRRLLAVQGATILITIWRAFDYKFHITGSSPDMFWGRTDIQVDSILWGVLLAILYGEPKWKIDINTFLSSSRILPVLLISLIAIELLPSLNWKIDLPLITIKAILIPPIILCTIIQSQRMPAAILENPILRQMGKISYSLYLWQQLFLVWNNDRIASLSFIQTFPNNIIAAIICATISMAVIERRMIALGRGLSSIKMTNTLKTQNLFTTH